VRTLGRGGTPLLLLHMSPLSGRMWDAVAPRLARDRHVIIPDRIGFGDSDRLTAPLAFPEYALATLDLLDALEVDVVDVLGIHTGACEAIELASTHEHRVRRIAIVALPAMSDDERRDFKANYGPPPEPVSDGSHLLRYWQWWSTADESTEWPVELVHSRVLDHLRAGPNVWWTYHAVFDYPAGERAASVRRPFIVFGPHDDLWETTRRAVTALPEHAVFVELPHLGYEIFTLAADEMGERVCAFFDEEDLT
jgi:pimeloyl-ACP methyl ester carboxylesterase